MGDDSEGSLVVVGLGYVGFALAQAAAQAGYRVHGVDTDSSVVDRLVSAGHDGVTLWSSWEDVPSGDVYIICVPTPLTLDDEPDLAPLRAAAHAIAGRLKSGDLVVVESTSYPGTTEEVITPILETSGLSAGVDFDVAFSPERIDPGNMHFELTTTPKIVAGLDERSTKRTVGLYEKFCEQVVAADGIREAELSKLIENSYRQINIAFVNELARICATTGIDLAEALRCASTKPFGFQAFSPGAGVGGQCIPIDPQYLNHWVRERTGDPLAIVDVAQRINGQRPRDIAHRAAEILREHTNGARRPRVIVIGVAYKAGVEDTRNSPATDVVRALSIEDFDVGFWDPIVSAWEVDGQVIPRWEITGPTPARVDLALVLQVHDVEELHAVVAVADVVLDPSGKLPFARSV